MDRIFTLTCIADTTAANTAQGIVRAYFEEAARTLPSLFCVASRS